MPVSFSSHRGSARHRPSGTRGPILVRLTHRAVWSLVRRGTNWNNSPGEHAGGWSRSARPARHATRRSDLLRATRDPRTGTREPRTATREPQPHTVAAHRISAPLRAHAT